MYKVPKAIANHPGVKECDDAEAGGAEGYKHDVILHEGWSFKNGRMHGGRCGFFRNVKEFRYAEPVQVPV